MRGENVCLPLGFRFNGVAIDIARNRRGPGTTQHHRSPKYRVVGSTLNPMLSGFPTSALGASRGPAASVLAASSSGSGFSGGGRLQDAAWAVAEMAHSSVHFGLPSHFSSVAFLWDERSQSRVIHRTSVRAAAQSLGKSGGNITGLECRPTYLENAKTFWTAAPNAARHTSSKPLMLAGLGVHTVAGPPARSEALRFTDLLVPVSDLSQKGQSSSSRLALNTRPHLLSEIPLYPSICCST
ncbi:hypothetical protein QQF64_012391 [Cirrhinus molitorella]|uniref:Uncharacterized protein n=1 Tax=Cirrhinus molitorella TaxID=172907 RepID=A0ABR3LXT3_9TELE